MLTRLPARAYPPFGASVTVHLVTVVVTPNLGFLRGMQLAGRSDRASYGGRCYTSSSSIMPLGTRDILDNSRKLSNAQIAARLYLSGAGVKGCVSRMLDKVGCASRARAGLLARDAPVSSARSPGRRSCRLELGLGARQAGLRPSPGRSCPPGAAGRTGPPRAGGCCDHVVDAVGDELLQDQRMHGVLLG
jgi:hypothetical protein